MQGTTHLAAGIMSGVLVGAQFNHPIIGGIVGGLAGLAPDIDHLQSTIGRKLPIIAVIISSLTHHRGATHTLWFCLLLSGLVLAVQVAVGTGYYWVALAVFAGAVSHLALDTLTKSGIQWLPPFKWHPRGFITTGDPWFELPMTVMFLFLAVQFSGLLTK